MKKTISIFEIALLAAFMGCSDQLPEKDSGNQLQIMSVEMPGQTKTAVTSATINEIEVYAINASTLADYATGACSSKFTKSGDEWTTEKPIEILGARGNASIYSCYPAAAI